MSETKTTELYTSVFSGSNRQIKFYFVSISQVKQMTIFKKNRIAQLFQS